MIVPINQILTAALECARRGWHVFPAPPGEKKSYKSAAYSGGRKWGATSDAEEIRRDLRIWPNANVGVVTGPASGLFVVEADTPKGHGVDGVAELNFLQAAHGTLSDTLMAESPSGSLHYYLKWIDGVKNSSGKIAPGVDVRGDGGMVIAPPSVRSDGAYRWLNDNRIADAPRWLLEKLCDEPRPLPGGHGAAGSALVSSFQGRASPSNQTERSQFKQQQEERQQATSSSSFRNWLLPTEPVTDHPYFAALAVDRWGREASYAYMSLRNAERELLAARQGERNWVLNKKCFALAGMAARGWIPISLIMRRMEICSHYNEHVRDDGIGQIRRTIDAGIRAGLQLPYPDLSPISSSNLERTEA